MKTELRIIISLLVFIAMLMGDIAMQYTNPLFVWILSGLTVAEIALYYLGGMKK